MNECEAQRCSQECANIYGSYQCYCRQGYQLAEDGHTCKGRLPGPLTQEPLANMYQAPIEIGVLRNVREPHPKWGPSPTFC